MFETYFYQAATIGLLALLTMAAISDFRRFIIPNWIPLSITVFYALFVTALGLTGQETPPWIAAIILAFVVTATSTVLFSLGQLGGGDVKLLGSVSLWAGPDFIADFLIVTALTGGALAIFCIIKNKLGDRTQRNATITGPMEGLVPAKKLKAPLPYGIAIAFGGFYTVSQLINSVT